MRELNLLKLNHPNQISILKFSSSTYLLYAWQGKCGPLQKNASSVNESFWIQNNVRKIVKPMWQAQEWSTLPTSWLRKFHQGYMLGIVGKLKGSVSYLENYKTSRNCLSFKTTFSVLRWLLLPASVSTLKYLLYYFYLWYLLIILIGKLNKF